MININKPKPFVLPGKIENKPTVDWLIIDENGQLKIDWENIPIVSNPVIPDIQNPWIVPSTNPYNPNPYNGNPVWIVQPNNILYVDTINNTSDNPTPPYSNSISYTGYEETLNWSTNVSNTVYN